MQYNIYTVVKSIVILNQINDKCVYFSTHPISYISIQVLKEAVTFRERGTTVLH